MITSVTIEVDGQTTQLVYNSTTGYYEAEVTAPNIPSALLEDKYYNMEITIASNEADTLVIDGEFDYKLMLKVMPEFIDYRQQHDVDLVKDLSKKYQTGIITEEEKALWNNDLIGALNMSDLQRAYFNLYCIATLYNMSELSEALEHRYDAATDTYDIQDPPGSNYFDELFAYTAEAMSEGSVYADTPSLPERPWNTYQKWNDVERILHDLYERGSQALDDLDYAGEFYAGETVATI